MPCTGLTESCYLTSQAFLSYRPGLLVKCRWACNASRMKHGTKLVQGLFFFFFSVFNKLGSSEHIHPCKSCMLNNSFGLHRVDNDRVFLVYHNTKLVPLHTEQLVPQTSKQQPDDPGTSLQPTSMQVYLGTYLHTIIISAETPIYSTCEDGLYSYYPLLEHLLLIFCPFPCGLNNKSMQRD